MNSEQDSGKVLQILHLEDSPQDAELIRARLVEAGFVVQLDWARNEQEFSRFLECGGYDLVLADYMLPGFEAPAALILTRSLSPGLPFIVVSGAIGDEKAVEILKQGATDYVLKDRLKKLPLAITRALDEFHAQAARRQAEENLQRERSLLRCIIDSASDLIFVKDRNSIYRVCNQASEDFIALSEAEQIGKTDFDFFPPEIAAQVQANDRLVIEEGGSQRTEEWVSYPDGRRVLFDTLKVPFVGPQGEVEGLVGICRDITARKLMEDALFFVAQRGWLASAENFFDALAQFLGERLNVDYVVIDRLGENPDTAETLALYAKGTIVPNMRYGLKGTPCENVMGRQLCVYPQGVQQLFPDDSLLAEMGVESYIGIPLWDSSGQPIGLIALMNSRPFADIEPATQLLQLVATRAAAELERARSDRALRTREREFRTLAENSPDCIARYDINGRTIYINPALERILGHPASEILGTTPLERASIDEFRTYQQKIAKVLESGEAAEIDLVLSSRGEGVRYHNVCFVAERGEDDAVIGVLAIGRDITERKQAEDERNANLCFFENMDRINRTIQGASEPEQMMGAVLDAVLEIFACDRASLLYPCDPEAEEWSVPMERTRPEYPAGFALGGKFSIDPEVADSFRRLLASENPLRFGPGTDNPLPAKIAEEFSIRSFMAMAIHPKVDKPWQFGIHQCFALRQWTSAEERLFEAIGRRLADGLTGLLSFRELRESEASYRRIVATANEGVWVLDAEGVTTFANARMGEMLGYAPQEMCGRLFTDFMLAEDVADHLQRLQNRRQGISESYERRFCHSDGRIIWAHASAAPIFDDEQHFLGSFGMFADMTERKQAEEELRKLNQAIEQSPVSIVITDTTGRIEFVNRKFSQITGYSRAEALGQNPRILKSGETSAEDYRQLWQTISSGEVWNGEFHNRKKNDELFWENATIAPVRDAEQQITHYVAVKEDITERKRLEEQLRQSQKLESVGQLAGGVAHDFNNMLAVIIGRSEMALRKLQPTQDQVLQASLQEIRQAAERSAELTRQLLAFARQQVIAPKRIELNDALEGMLKMLRRLIGEGIDLVWLPGSESLQVEIDPVQLDQILINLCVNARDAIVGTGKITIETHPAIFDQSYYAEHLEYDPCEYVLLEVSDDGQGMDKTTRERIFEPFYTTKEIGCGTGLGLATVYGIVKQNRGFINVYSELDQGTTFKIYLPRITGSVLTEQAAEAPLARGVETILLVEDEPSLLSLTALMLESCGYRVLPAASPTEALGIANQCSGEIDLLLTDVVMPEMSGRELAERLQAEYPQLRCLYMSGYPSNVILSNAALEEGVYCIQKPFALRDLANEVRRVLDEHLESD